MVNSPLIRPYFLGGVALGGGTLDSHDITKRQQIPSSQKGALGNILEHHKLLLMAELLDL